MTDYRRHANALMGAADHYLLGIPSSLAGLNPLGAGMSATKQAADDARRQFSELYHRDFLAMPEAVYPNISAFPKTAAGHYDTMMRRGKAGADFADRPPRPFTNDYPRSDVGHAGQALTRDIDGRSIDPRASIAGRRTVGGADEALGAADFEKLAGALVDSVGPVTQNQIGRHTVGKLISGPDQTGQTRRRIEYADNLDPADIARAVPHELGHAIDELSGRIPLNPNSVNARRVYQDGLNGNAETLPRRQWQGPETYGYTGARVREELVAEALRAYMTNPNALKTMAPGIAAELRKEVNTNPRVNRHLHLNSLMPPAFAAGGIGLLTADPNE